MVAQKKLTLTFEQLQEYHELRSQRLELNRQAEAIERKEKALAKHFQQYMQGIKVACISRIKDGVRFTLSLGTRKGRVSWKDVVIDKLGALFAQKLQEEAPEVTVVSVAKFEK